MEPRRAPYAPSAPACQACGLAADDLARVARHVEHVVGPLSAIEQRQLRSHLFALLAALDGTIDLPE
jgi:hypothetical protein